MANNPLRATGSNSARLEPLNTTFSKTSILFTKISLFNKKHDTFRPFKPSFLKIRLKISNKKLFFQNLSFNKNISFKGKPHFPPPQALRQLSRGPGAGARDGRAGGDGRRGRGGRVEQRLVGWGRWTEGSFFFSFFNVFFCFSGDVFFWFCLVTFASFPFFF